MSESFLLGLEFQLGAHEQDHVLAEFLQWPLCQ